VNVEVVYETARLVGEHVVLTAPDLQSAGFVEGGVGEELGSSWTYDLDLGHMADVEQPCSCPHAQVLVVDAVLVVQWHLVAGEVDHPGAQLDVLQVERCALHRANDITLTAGFITRSHDGQPT